MRCGTRRGRWRHEAMARLGNRGACARARRRCRRRRAAAEDGRVLRVGMIGEPPSLVMDGLMAFPAIMLAIAMMAVLGLSVVNVVVAIGVVYTPRVARVVRGSVQASFVFAAAVLTEAALSFLGVGVPPYVPSWGNILSEGRLYTP